MHKLKSVMTLIAAVAVIAATGTKSRSSETWIPPNGFVPDAATANRIAEAVWIPIYGEAHIAAERPFKVSLKGDVWTVTGKDLPPSTLGGVAEADISKTDGRILRISHGQ